MGMRLAAGTAFALLPCRPNGIAIERREIQVRASLGPCFVVTDMSHKLQPPEDPAVL